MVTREKKNKEIQDAIEEEEKRGKRRKIIKRFFCVTILLITFFFGLYFYSRYLVMLGLVVKEQRIIDAKIPNSFNGIKIVQFSDLEYGSNIFQSEVNHIVDTINQRKPDIIIFTGNIMSKDYKLNTKEQEKLISSLKKLDTSIGKYAIMGKYDQKDYFTTIMNQSDFIVLDNTYDLVYRDTNTPILITGLSSLIRGDRNIEEAFNYFSEEVHNPDIFTIVAMSETDGLDELITTYNPDLVLAGNSLNGEIRIPPFGGIVKIEGSSTYDDPYYKINSTKVYISSGIASPNTGIRLFNNPSINLFRLSNKSS